MTVDERISLTDLTTLRVGGPARFVLTISSPRDLIDALTFVRERAIPFVVLGEGSNVLPDDTGYEGAILLMRLMGIAFDPSGHVVVGAGVHWDDFVTACAERGLWGVENLAGIPGTVGAAPVQNIGAYGAEARQIIESVTAYDTEQEKMRIFPLDECGFSYRDSRFKHEPNLIITSVTFRLQTNGAPNIEYADLQKAQEEGADLSTPAAIGNTVRSVRGRKFPDLTEFGTAGSFFKNPIVPESVYRELSERFKKEAEPYGGIPRYSVPGQVKIPLAFILDKFLLLRGYKREHAFLFGNQPLVLVAEHGAKASDIEALAHDIETRVFEATGITIEREVRNLSAHETK